MKIEIRLRIDVGTEGLCDEELLVLDKPHDQLEQVGLSLAEARELLARVVGAQAAASAGLQQSRLRSHRRNEIQGGA